MGVKAWSVIAAAALLTAACDRTHEERAPAEDPFAAIANASPTLPSASAGAPLAHDAATIYVVTTSAIYLGKSKVVDLPDLAAQATDGVSASQKNGMVIEPLLRAAEAAHKHETRTNGTYPALLAVDARTPYRVLGEVTYTLGQAEYSLRMVGRDASGAPVVMPSPAPALSR